MPGKYKNLLSPIKIGNTVFRNRLIVSRSSPHFSQGTERYPTEATITDYANKARNGAALVTCGGVGMPHFILEKDLAAFAKDRSLPGLYDLNDRNCLIYLSQLTSAIHFYGGKASMQIGGFVPVQYDVSTGIPGVDIGLPTVRKGKEIPASLLDGIADDFANQAAVLKRVGFDAVYLHMAYRLTILGRFLSPLTNKRTDKYGGSLENQARFPIMVADRIKKKCGSDFIIEASISGAEGKGGRTLNDTIKQAKMFAGHIDLLQVRTTDIDPAHPTGLNPEHTPFLSMAEAVKKSGAKIAVVTAGGYLDPAVCEDIIASGKADFIASARTWISNPNWGLLAYEGRAEDIVPCIRCNICIGGSHSSPFGSVCSVNPRWGLEHKIERMIEPPARKKKVAIVGGGVAGMEAALVASGRGHQVTLYEKSGSLGGPLKTAANVAFKWPQKEFINYMVRKVGKAKVQVLLNTEATQQMLKAKKYDAVLVAVGAEPIVPSIPGIKGKNVVCASEVYGKEKALAKKVVVIGGGEVGIETGMHLAQKGHEVTLLEMGDKLAPNAPKEHYYPLLKEAWEKQANLKCIVKACCESISAEKVTYLGADGKRHSIPAASVVIAVGMKPRNDLAQKFFGAADRCYLMGDCNVAGNIQTAMRSGYSTASMI
jgi:2,4-dienoyl-CoA reductase-like NADH-dependent reductase (Old Yellow Enzyme family)/thioredoxin reductase